MVLMNNQTHLRWVFRSTVPADAPTTKHPWLCLGYTSRIKVPIADALVALLWAQVVLDEEIPEDLHNPHAHSEELTEVLPLRRSCPNASRRLVLDVPGNQNKVRGEVVLVLAGVVVGRITGG
jgi:hypothetical protein